MKTLTVEQFQRDVANHKMTMTVRLDAGLYRHLAFRTEGPNSWNLWFELVTWPNAIIIRGDMGSWSFSRVEDMFRFFRNSKELEINPHYWEEKCESVDTRTGPCKVFDSDYYRECILESLDNYDLEGDKHAATREALQQALRETDDDQRSIYDAACGFEYEDFRLSDPWEIGGRVYSYHFLWCLYAIVWGIQQYDAMKAAEVPA